VGAAPLTWAEYGWRADGGGTADEQAGRQVPLGDWVTWLSFELGITSRTGSSEMSRPRKRLVILVLLAAPLVLAAPLGAGWGPDVNTAPAAASALTTH